MAGGSGQGAKTSRQGEWDMGKGQRAGARVQGQENRGLKVEDKGLDVGERGLSDRTKGQGHECTVQGAWGLGLGAGPEEVQVREIRARGRDQRDMDQGVRTGSRGQGARPLEQGSVGRGQGPGSRRQGLEGQDPGNRSLKIGA